MVFTLSYRMLSLAFGTLPARNAAQRSRTASSMVRWGVQPSSRLILSDDTWYERRSLLGEVSTVMGLSSGISRSTIWRTISPSWATVWFWYAALKVLPAIMSAGVVSSST